LLEYLLDIDFHVVTTVASVAKDGAERLAGGKHLHELLA
jgi:hypothetical protein